MSCAYVRCAYGQTTYKSSCGCEAGWVQGKVKVPWDDEVHDYAAPWASKPKCPKCGKGWVSVDKVPDHIEQILRTQPGGGNA